MNRSKSSEQGETTRTGLSLRKRTRGETLRGGFHVRRSPTRLMEATEDSRARDRKIETGESLQRMRSAPSARGSMSTTGNHSNRNRCRRARIPDGLCLAECRANDPDKIGIRVRLLASSLASPHLGAGWSPDKLRFFPLHFRSNPIMLISKMDHGYHLP